MENENPIEAKSLVVPSLGGTKAAAAKVSMTMCTIAIAIVLVVFVGLLVLISYLPMSLSLKIISLILGSFLVFDIHHTIKSYVRESSN